MKYHETVRGFKEAHMKDRTVAAALICIGMLLTTHPQVAGALSQTDNAVLTVSSGLPNKGGNNVIAGASVFLLRESFEVLLRKSHVFDGQASVWQAWNAACMKRTPACAKAAQSMRSAVVTDGLMDATGSVVLDMVDAGSYYVCVLAFNPQTAQSMVWDVRVDLKPGENAITLDQRNLVSFDARAARRDAPGQSVAGSQRCQGSDPPRPTPSSAQANSTLSVRGGGYVYTYTETDRRTGQVTNSFTERGNFSNTTLYLLDEDAETVFQEAGIKPVVFPVRLSLIESVGFYDAFGEVKNVPGMEMLAGLLGGSKKDLESPEAKAEFDCAMNAIRSHSVAHMTTNANASGTFPRVPAGTYYLYGRFYRVQKPFRGGGMVWNLKVVVKPGPNNLTLTVNNAAYK
jgi:hypothetical protein